MAITQATLFGFDRKETSKYIARTVAAGETNVIKMDMPVLGNFANPEIESEIIEYADDTKRNLATNKYVLNIELKPKFYNDASNYDTFYQSNIFLKKSLFIDLKDYKLRPSDYPADNVMRVYLRKYSVEHDAEAGTKKIKIELEA